MPSKAEYEFLRELGQGSIGVVHLARRKRDGKRCALKQVQTRHFRTDKLRTQVLNEAKILKSLNCAHVVEYVDVFIENECFFLALQFCERGDLKGFLKNHSGPLPDERVWRIFIRLLLALHYLHTRRIVHRDVKSENVFLTGDDGAKIGDLRMLPPGHNECSVAMVGLPQGVSRNLSPEEIGVAGLSQSLDGQKVDIWGLGTILYEMLSDGHRGPFDDAVRIPELMHKIAHAEPRGLSPGVDANLRGCCERLLRKSPAERPRAGELLDTEVVRDMGAAHDSDAMQQFLSARAGLAIEQGLASSLPDGATARLCQCVGLKQAESDLGTPFHRLGRCEICIAQNLEGHFGILRRRHHCRSCGASICARHSAGLRNLEHLGYSMPQRICDACYATPEAGGQPASSTEHESS